MSGQIKFVVSFDESGLVKKVQRLNVMFDVEDKERFQARVSKCEYERAQLVGQYFGSVCGFAWNLDLFYTTVLVF